jgi:uncharacterized protein (DUF433 family)
MKRRELGKYLVADPKICHGKLTFKGTRIFVDDVVEMVREGRDWDDIIWECHGSITKEAIMEAVRLVGKNLIKNNTGRSGARSLVSSGRKYSRKPAN